MTQRKHILVLMVLCGASGLVPAFLLGCEIAQSNGLIMVVCAFFSVENSLVSSGKGTNEQKECFESFPL